MKENSVIITKIPIAKQLTALMLSETAAQSLKTIANLFKH